MSLEEKIDAFIEAALPPASDHRAGGLDRASALLEAEPDLARRSIHVASMVGEMEAVKSLLREDPRLASLEGGPRSWDPLLYLCFSIFLRLDPDRAAGMVRISEILLEHGADPNTHWIDPSAGDDCRESALYGAVGIANNPELARLLLEAGADPNDGETPYHAVEHDGVPCAELLVRHGLNELGLSIALRHKLDYDDLAGVRKLLELGADPNITPPFGKTALHQAVFRSRSRECFELLLSHGADPDIENSDGKTAYALAAMSGQSANMQLLRARGANTSLDPTVQFLSACARGDVAEVQTALAQEPGLVVGLSPEDRAALVEAAAVGNLDGVRLMLDAGIDVNTRGRTWNETAAHRAAIDGHLETIRLLLQRGADLTVRDRSYHASPLGWAAHGAQTRVLELLLADPSRIDLRDAVEFGCVERVGELLGAMGEMDVDCPIGDGEPGVLLRAAAHGGHLELVRFLLNRGADANRKNSEGSRALDYAEQRGHSEVAALLRGRTENGERS